MTGAARTLDKVEQKATRNPAADFAVQGAGRTKREYGRKHGIDTSEGYYAGKEQHETEEAAKQAADEAAAAEAEQRKAAEERDRLATEAGHKAQREALKRKGRRASILTGPGGVDDNRLGNVGAR